MVRDLAVAPRADLAQLMRRHVQEPRYDGWPELPDAVVVVPPVMAWAVLLRALPAARHYGVHLAQQVHDRAAGEVTHRSG